MRHADNIDQIRVRFFLKSLIFFLLDKNWLSVEKKKKIVIAIPGRIRSQNAHTFLRKLIKTHKFLEIKIDGKSIVANFKQRECKMKISMNLNHKILINF